MKKKIIIVLVLLVIQCFASIVKGGINIINNNSTIQEINKIEGMIQ